MFDNRYNYNTLELESEKSENTSSLKKDADLKGGGAMSVQIDRGHCL
jgi:hypothetical protein